MPRERTAPLSPEQRRFIARKIRILRHEGYPQPQAIAIAYRMACEPRSRARLRRSSRRDPASDKPPDSGVRLRTFRVITFGGVSLYPFEVTFTTDDGVERRNVLHARDDRALHLAVRRFFDAEGVVLQPGGAVRMRWLPIAERDPGEPPPSGVRLRQRAPVMTPGFALARGIRQSSKTWEDTVVGSALAARARFVDWRRIDDVLHAVWTIDNMLYAQVARGSKHPSRFPEAT